MRQNLSLGPIFRLIPYVLPNALSFAIPGTILLTVCIVYGRMSAANEITALKSAGISPWKISLPAGPCFLSSACFRWGSTTWRFPWGYAGVQSVVIESIEEIAYKPVACAAKSLATAGSRLSSKRVEGRGSCQPVITFNASGGSPASHASWPGGRSQIEFRANTLSIELTNGTVEVGSDMTIRLQRHDRARDSADRRPALRGSLGPGHLSWKRGFRPRARGRGTDSRPRAAGGRRGGLCRSSRAILRRSRTRSGNSSGNARRRRNAAQRPLAPSPTGAGRTVSVASAS